MSNGEQQLTIRRGDPAIFEQDCRSATATLQPVELGILRNILIAMAQAHHPPREDLAPVTLPRGGISAHDLPGVWRDALRPLSTEDAGVMLDVVREAITRLDRSERASGVGLAKGRETRATARRPK
jgi:hypothetical protein